MDSPTLSRSEAAEAAMKKELESPTRLAPKTKADSLDGPLAKCSLDKKRERPPEDSPRQTTRFGHKAAPGSVYSLVQTQRKQLWVPTLAWTGAHLRGLSIVFKGPASDQQRIGERNSAASDGVSGGEVTPSHKWNDKDWLRATKQLSSCNLTVRKLAAEELLGKVGLVKAG
jgi:hypothetical protein